MELKYDWELNKNIIYIDNFWNNSKSMETYKKDFKLLKKTWIKNICSFDKLKNKNFKNESKTNLIKIIKKFKYMIESNYKKNNSDYDSYLYKKKIKNINTINILNNLKNPSISIKKEYKLEDFNNLNLQIPIINCKNLVSSSIQMLNVFNPFENKNNLTNLVMEIFNNYRILPYHNYSHAFSVMQFLYLLFNKSNQLNDIISNKFKFYILLAGLSHDLRHNGTNNNYQLNKKKKISIDNLEEKSILEKMHSATFLKLLNNNKNYFFDNIEEYNISKDIIVYSILSTDMVNHSNMLDNLKLYKKSDGFKEYKDKKVL